MGAVIPVRLSAPTKVVVFQWTVRNGRPASLATYRPAIKPRHLGGRTGLVDEDEPVRIEIELTVKPGLPPLQDV